MASTSFRTAVVGVATTGLLGSGIYLTAPVAEATHRLPKVCYKGKIICINKSVRKIRLMSNGRLIVQLDARFGARRTPTRNGYFRVYWKNRHHVSSLYGSAMPFSMFFSGGQAIHYSSDFARNGYRGASHGCVNTRQWSKMKRLYNSAPTGTRVYIYY